MGNPLRRVHRATLAEVRQRLFAEAVTAVRAAMVHPVGAAVDTVRMAADADMAAEGIHPAVLLPAAVVAEAVVAAAAGEVAAAAVAEAAAAHQVAAAAVVHRVVVAEAEDDKEYIAKEGQRAFHHTRCHHNSVILHS